MSKPNLKELSDRSEERLKLIWFSRLRFGAILGQIVIFVVAREVMKLDLVYRPFLFVCGLMIVSQGVFSVFIERFVKHYSLVSGAVMVLDVFFLTIILYFYGGHANPFSLMYLVNVTLASLLLGVYWTWGLVALSSLCFAALFFFHHPVPELSIHHGDQPFTFHLQGMLVAFVLISSLLGYFLTKMRTALDEQKKEVNELRSRSANEERLASLTTLAAGAAHELGTPLGTIAVVIHELENGIKSRKAEDILLEDTALIRNEVIRCERILRQMSGELGEPGGEMFVRSSVGEIIDDIKSRLGHRERSFEISGEEVLGKELVTAKQALVSALLCLIKNSFDATLGNKPIRMEIRAASDAVFFDVQDDGPGMSAEMISRLGEPFYTTKEPGAGLGLGVFLVRLFAKRVGGSLSYNSLPGKGTVATLCVPMKVS